MHAFDLYMRASGIDKLVCSAEMEAVFIFSASDTRYGAESPEKCPASSTAASRSPDLASYLVETCRVSEVAKRPWRSWR